MALIGALAVGIGTVGARAALEVQKSPPAPPWLSLFGVTVRPDGKIFAVGSKALLITSADHGKTWKDTTLHEREGNELFQDRDLYSIRFAPDGKTGLIVGESGTVLRTTDGGENWTVVDSGTGKNLLKVFPVDDQNAVAVGADGTIIRSTDGGVHWQTRKSPQLITLFDVTFTDKNNGWIAGEFATIMNSTDGGQTWTVKTGGNITDFTIGPYFTINFIDPQHAIAGGLAGEMGVSDDGGKTWTKSMLPDQIGAYAVAVDPSTKKIFAVGTGGRGFERDANGKWREAPRATFNDLTDIAVSGNQGVMVGLNGTILLSDNAGETWQAVQ